MGVIWSLKPPGQGASQKSYRGQSQVAASSTLEYARWRARTRIRTHALRKRARKTSSARSSTHLCILGEVRPTDMLLDACIRRDGSSPAWTGSSESKTSFQASRCDANMSQKPEQSTRQSLGQSLRGPPHQKNNISSQPLPGVQILTFCHSSHPRKFCLPAGCLLC